MSPISVPRPLVEQSFRIFAECGEGRHECVTYWVARQTNPNVVHRIIHPIHRAGPFGYQVDSDFVTKLFLDLRLTNEMVRAQVHTHPRDAGHSSIDDNFALAPSTGFLSLVAPDFGVGRRSLDDCYLVEMQSDGTWLVLDPRTHLVLV